MKRNRKAKILATLGPSSSSREIIEEMFVAGCDVFRLNFSHDTIENHRNNLEIIRDLEKNTSSGKNLLLVRFIYPFVDRPISKSSILTFSIHSIIFDFERRENPPFPTPKLLSS